MRIFPNSIIRHLLGKLSTDGLLEELEKDNCGSAYLTLYATLLSVFDLWVRALCFLVLLPFVILRRVVSLLEGLPRRCAALLVALFAGWGYWNAGGDFYDGMKATPHLISQGALLLTSFISVAWVYREIVEDSAKIRASQVTATSAILAHVAFLLVQARFQVLVADTSPMQLVITAATAFACWLVVGGFSFLSLQAFSSDRRK
jgi:hypothetical protein